MRPSCFLNSAEGEIEESGSMGNWFKDGILRRAFDLIVAGKEGLEKDGGDSESSVQSSLSAGKKKIIEKLGAASAEMVSAATREETPRAAKEIANLLFHVLMFLASEGIPLESVFSELESKFGEPGI